MHVPTQSSREYQRKLLSSSKYIKLFVGNEWEEGIYLNRKSEIPNHPLVFSPFRGGTDSFDWNVGGDLAYGHHYNIDYYFRGTHQPYNGYGSSASNEQLYYVLVNRFNGGEDFVQVFLDEYAPSLVDMNKYLDPISEIINVNNEYADKVATLQEYNNALEDLDNDITSNEAETSFLKDVLDTYETSYLGYDTDSLVVKQDGTLDMRYKENKNYIELKNNYYDTLALINSYKKSHKNLATRRTKTRKIANTVVQDVDSLSELINSGGYTFNGKTWEQSTKDLQKELREAYIDCMRNGTLAPRGLSENTIKKRIRAGLPPEPAFFASGNFAESIRFIVKIQ